MEDVQELSARLRTLENVALTSHAPPDHSESIKAIKGQLDALTKGLTEAQQTAAQARAAASRDLVTTAALNSAIRTATIGIGEGVASIADQLETDFDRKLSDSAGAAAKSARAAERQPAQLAHAMREYLVGRAYHLAHGSADGSVAHAREAALNAMKSTANSVDGIYASLKGPVETSASTAGGLIAWALAHQDAASDYRECSVMLRDARASIVKRLDRSVEALDAVRVKAAEHAACADYLEGSGPVPSVDGMTGAALAIVRMSVQAGLMPSPAGEIRTLSTAALMATDEAHRKAAVIRGAAMVAADRQSQKALIRFASGADTVTKTLLLARASRVGRAGELRRKALHTLKNSTI